MYKLIRETLLTSVILLFSTHNSVFAGDLDPVKIIMKSETSGKNYPAFFPHNAHQFYISCSQCHHGMDRNNQKTEFRKEQEVVKCSTCHNRKKMSDKTIEFTPLKKFLRLDTMAGAAHASCLDCHSVLSHS